jgi:hypothetical protein
MRHLVGRRGGDANQSQTSDSSVSSAAIVSPPPATAGARAGAGAGAGEAVGRRATSTRQGLQGPLSPRRTAELAGRGQGQGGAKGRGTSREGSDGTPSMGSSFSDLDGGFRSQPLLCFVSADDALRQMLRSRSRRSKKRLPVACRTGLSAAG